MSSPTIAYFFIFFYIHGLFAVFTFKLMYWLIKEIHKVLENNFPQKSKFEKQKDYKWTI